MKLKKMNVINVKIDFTKGTCEKTGISLITGDYATTKVVFEFDSSAETGTKVFKMKNPSEELVYADEIVGNEVVLVGIDENEEIYSLFTEEGDYTFEVSLYGTNSRITSVCGYITANKEQVIVDGEVVEEKITLFDNLINELNEAIQETNNLDIDVEKVEHTATVTITKKDGTQKEVEIKDGDQVDLSNYYTKAETNSLLNGKANISDIPTKTSDLTNDSDYTTKTYVDNIVGDIETILTTLDIGSGCSL